MLPIFEPYFVIPVTVLLSVLFLLAIPVTVSFSIVRREAFSGRITVGWLFGMLHISPSLSKDGDRAGARRRTARTAAEASQPAGPGGPGGPEEPTVETPSRKPRDPAKRILRVLKTEGFVRGLLIFLRDTARRVRFVSLQVAGRFGLDNPCDTGRLWGVFCAFTGFLHGADRVRLRVEPEFNEAVFEFDGRGEIRIVPVTLFLPTVRFLLSPATLRAAWAASRRTGRAGRPRRPRQTG